MCIRSLQPVKSADQRADVVKPRQGEYQPGGWWLHSIPTEVTEGDMQECLPRSRYRNSAEKVQVSLPMTGGQVSTQIGGYFVGGVKW